MFYPGTVNVFQTITPGPGTVDGPAGYNDIVLIIPDTVVKWIWAAVTNEFIKIITFSLGGVGISVLHWPGLVQVPVTNCMFATEPCL